MVKQIYQDMFSNAVHIGHRTQKWNPLMREFIHGEKNGIHVINLEKTNEMLEEAIKFLQKTLSEGKTVLFVSTKPQSAKFLRSIAKKLHMPYVDNRWIPGLLTNFNTVRSRIKYMLSLEEQEASGEFEKYTKKEAAKFKREMQKLKFALDGVRDLTKKPDVVFVVDVMRDSIAVEEANVLNVPVVGLVDTNVDPRSIAYPIPANDDALKSLSFIFGELENALTKFIKK